MSRALTLFAALLLVFGGCRDNDEPLTTPEQQDLQIQEFLTRDTTIEAFKYESGFYYIPENDVISPNTGDIFFIYYEIMTLDSVVVAKHQAADGEPVMLQRGDSTVYPLGLDYALAYMGTGDIFKFIFPSHLAYRDIGIGENLPPNTITHVVVEVVRAENEGVVLNREVIQLDDYIEDKGFRNDTTNTDEPVVELPSGLRIYKPEPDTSALRPVAGNLVGINWTGYFLNDANFGAYTGGNVFEFEIGAGEVIRGLEEGVLNMRLGERATILIPSQYAYGPSVTVVPPGMEELLVEREIIPTYAAKIPAFTPLIFEVELRSIE